MAIEDWGHVVEEAGEATPVVYHFRPTRYVRVAPERLRDWEDYFAKHVGLVPDRAASSLDLDHRSATMSGSHNRAWDDADYV
jgi:hypothetical protein